MKRYIAVRITNDPRSCHSCNDPRATVELRIVSNVSYLCLGCAEALKQLLERL